MLIKIAPDDEVTGEQTRWKRGFFSVPWGCSPNLMERAVREATVEFLRQMERRGLHLNGKMVHFKYATEPEFDDSGNAVQKVDIIGLFTEELKTRRFSVSDNMAMELVEKYPRAYKLLE